MGVNKLKMPRINIQINDYIFNKSVDTSFRLEISKQVDDIIEIIEPNNKEWSIAYKLYHNYMYNLEGL